MSELTLFIWKTTAIVLAIPLTFFLVYLTGLMIAKLAVKFCPECSKRKKGEKAKERLLDSDLL